MVKSRHRLALAGVALLLSLAACATPQQRCIAQVTADARTLQAQIKTTEATLARGYALHRQAIPYTDTRICYDNDRKPFTCFRTRHRWLETPVTVDLNNERAKLAKLKSKLTVAQRNSAAKVDACRHKYRE